MRFADATEGDIDLRPFLFEREAGVFSHLKDPDEFEKVYVHEGAVTWPGGLDLAPDAMYDDIRKSEGPARSPRKRAHS